MKFKLYAIYDKIAGTISAPFLAINTETAIRNLKERQEAMKRQELDYANDITLVYIAEYNITPKLYTNEEGQNTLEDVIKDDFYGKSIDATIIEK